MTRRRRKYVIASLFVVHFLCFHGRFEFYDEQFILQSFQNHVSVDKKDTAAKQIRRLPIGRNNTLALALEATKITSDVQDKDQFCPLCAFNENKFCYERLEYLMSKHHLSEEKAKKNEDILSRCQNPWIGHKIYREEDEPHIILHAGPHKTGTTALQAFIYDLMFTNHTTFLSDNLRVPTYDELPGVFAKEGVGLNLPHCCIARFKRDGGTMNKVMCARMRLSFPKFVEDAYNKAENILIVAEDFDRVAIDFERLGFYLQPYKKINVVATYRRLHDWLPSWYSQIMDHYTPTYAKGEEIYPSFVEWLNATYNEFQEAHAIRLADRYMRQDFVESVQLINLHEVGKKSIEHFFCNYLQAKAVCQVIRDGAAPSKSNIGANHEYERLIVKAKLSGKIKIDITTKPVNLIRASLYLKARMEEINVHNSMPKKCPEDSLLEKVFRTEMDQEMTYFSEWHEHQGGKAGLRKSFNKAVEKKFCSFDDEKALESGILDPIFQSFPKVVLPQHVMNSKTITFE